MTVTAGKIGEYLKQSSVFDTLSPQDPHILKGLRLTPHVRRSYKLVVATRMSTCSKEMLSLLR